MDTHILLKEIMLQKKKKRRKIKLIVKNNVVSYIWLVCQHVPTGSYSSVFDSVVHGAIFPSDGLTWLIRVSHLSMDDCLKLPHTDFQFIYLETLVCTLRKAPCTHRVTHYIEWLIMHASFRIKETPTWTDTFALLHISHTVPAALYCIKCSRNIWNSKSSASLFFVFFVQLLPCCTVSFTYQFIYCLPVYHPLPSIHLLYHLTLWVWLVWLHLFSLPDKYLPVDRGNILKSWSRVVRVGVTFHSIFHLTVGFWL